MMLSVFTTLFFFFFFFSSRRRHTRSDRDWSSECALPICDDAQRTFETGWTVASLISFHFEVEQLESDRQRNSFPAVGDLRLLRRSGHSDLPAGRNPLLKFFSVLLDLNSHAIGKIGCSRRGRRFLRSHRREIHPLPGVRHDSIDDKLPVRPTRGEWLVQLDLAGRSAILSR